MSTARSASRAARWWALAAALAGFAVAIAMLLVVAPRGGVTAAGPTAEAGARALVALGFAFGALAGGAVADARHGDRRVVLGALGLGALVAFVWFVAAGRALVADARVAAPIAPVGAAIALFAGACAGAFVPALVRHALCVPAAPARRAAELLAAAGAGAGAGLLAAGAFLLPRFGGAATAGVCVLASVAAALALFAAGGGAGLAPPLDRTVAFALDPGLARRIDERRAHARRRQGRRVRFAIAPLTMVASAVTGFTAAAIATIVARGLGGAVPPERTGLAVAVAVLLAYGAGAGLGAAIGSPLRVRQARTVAAVGASWLAAGAAVLIGGAVLAHLLRLAAAAGAPRETWLAAFAHAFVVVGPLGFFAGVGTPLLLKLSARGAVGSGRTVAGFVALHALGAAAAFALAGSEVFFAPTTPGALALIGWLTVALGTLVVARARRALGRTFASTCVRTAPAWLVAGGAFAAFGMPGPGASPLGWQPRAGARLLAYVEGPGPAAALVDEPAGRRVVEVDGERTAVAGRAAADAERRARLAFAWSGAAEDARVLVAATGAVTEARVLAALGAADVRLVDARPALARLDAHERAAAERVEPDAHRRVTADVRREFARTSGLSLVLLVADATGAVGGAPLARSDLVAARRALAPRGVCVLWLPIDRLGDALADALAAAFCDAFPGAAAMGDVAAPDETWIALVGAPETFEPPGRVSFARARPPAGIDPLDAAGALLAGGEDVLARALRGVPRARLHGAWRARPTSRDGSPGALARWHALVAEAAPADRDPARRARRIATGAVLAARRANGDGRERDALAFARDAHRADPEWRVAADALVAALERCAAGRAADVEPASAEEAARELAAGPYAAEGEALLAELLLARGERAEARAAAARALALVPGHERGLAVLQRASAD